MAQHNRISAVSPAKYYPTFLRSMRSELRKFFWQRSTIATGSVAVGLNVLIPSLASAYSDSSVSAMQVVSGSVLLMIFFIALGAGAVTPEYSMNTMRTTTLADPKRLRAAGAKLSAVFLVGGFYALLATTLPLAAIHIFAPGVETIDSYQVLSLLYFWVLLVASTILGAGLGYLLRSTAGAIVAGVLLLLVSNFLTAIPKDFFQETLPQYLPLSLSENALRAYELSPTYAVPAEYQMYTTEPWPHLALALFCLYPLVIAILGVIRYRRSDV